MDASTVKPKRKRTYICKKPLARVDGEIWRRSVLLTEDGALNFLSALLLQCVVHSPEIKISHRSLEAGKAKCYFVRWIPDGRSNRMTMRAKLQQDRVDRAIQQKSEMVFLPMADRPGWWFCAHDYPDGSPMGIYIVHPTVRDLGCDCPDYFYRCESHRMECKHRIALRNWIEEETDAGVLICTTSRSDWPRANWAVPHTP